MKRPREICAHRLRAIHKWSEVADCSRVIETIKACKSWLKDLHDCVMQLPFLLVSIFTPALGEHEMLLGFDTISRVWIIVKNYWKLQFVLLNKIFIKSSLKIFGHENIYKIYNLPPERTITFFKLFSCNQSMKLENLSANWKLIFQRWIVTIENLCLVWEQAQ